MAADRRNAGRAAGASPDEAAAPADVPVSRWSAVGSAAMEALRHRAELAALEAAEARDHLTATGALVILAAGLALLAGLAGTLAAVAAVSDHLNAIAQGRLVPADNHESVRRLTRDQQKQLLALACAADRLEWRIQAKHLAATSRRSAALGRMVQAGLEWLPRAVALRPHRTPPRWGGALSWIRTGLGLFL